MVRSVGSSSQSNLVTTEHSSTKPLRLIEFTQTLLPDAVKTTILTAPSIQED
jgi:hypothetical protein